MMKYVSALLVAGATCGLAAPAAQAATAHHHSHRAMTRRAASAAPAPAIHDPQVMEEMARLRAQVTALQDRLDAEHAAQASSAQQIAQTEQQVGSLSKSVAETPKLAKAAADTEIASAIDKEHKKGYTDFKGIRLTPGGFLELAGVYRQHFQGNDISSSFSVPFPNAHNYYIGEGRLTARQSRVSFLAQGKANAHTTLSMYGEFDFQGAAQTANSNESNSYNPRIRHLYGTIDWDREDSGIHLLAGQNWSLLTLNSGGITPRKEVTPLVIEAQYVPGFTWARQPQVRLAADFMDHHVWLAVSAENPATTFGGSVPGTVTNTLAGGSGFNNANALSFNSAPDFIQKAAFEGSIGGHALHVEGFAIERSFTARLNGVGNINKGTVGYGGGVTFQVAPKILDVQFSGMGGKGIGRYGTSGLPDVTFDADGSIHPINETILLAGAILHPTPMLDIYAYGGEELQSALALSGTYGIGNLAANDSGCYVEGGTCGGNTRRIRQLTTGLWQKVYNGSFGRAQIGVQYSYTQRDLFVSANSNGVPTTNQSIGMISLRYYPF